MEADERFVFTLDGQLATVDDYLEVRPEAEGRLRSLIETGRLAIGPWQVLMDEFLVSGESIVRNLEAGIGRGESLGGVMPIGYLPDMFGHVAQMPQLLRGAGIEHAALWRGVPAAIDRNAFRWESPDGSWVRAEYLVRGYWGAAYLIDLPERLADSLELLETTLHPFFTDRPVLAMYGTDHSEPILQLPELIESLNSAQDRYRVELATLAGYIARDGSSDGLPRWSGELRSGARANMLMGVTSARIDLKQACARAERALERYAEPLAALWSPAWPGRLLELAWRRVIESSAHDSICGCSADAVCSQVLVRYAEAEQIATGLAQEAAEAIASDVPAGSFAVVNPLPRARTGLVELELPIPEEWKDVALELPDGSLAATQEIGRSEPLLWETELRGAELPERMFRRMQGRTLLRRTLHGVRIERPGGGPRITFDVRDDDGEGLTWLDVEELKREIEDAAATAADESWQVRIRAAPRRTLVAAVPAPPLGWTSARPACGRGRVDNAVRAENGAMTNGLVEVRVEPEGALALRANGVELSGVGRLVDGGDAGDSYNYAPPARDLLLDVPGSVRVEPRSAGPLRAELAIIRTYRWPVAGRRDGSRRSEETVTVATTMLAELRAGEPFVRLEISFENRCSDHRLRFHIPLARPAGSSFAEGQFAVVERGLEAEGGYGEAALPTFPAHAFVDAGGVAVLGGHALEYELLSEGELALTLLRSIGLISRDVHPLREDPAGPSTPIPAAQCLGPWSIGFGLFPHAGSWESDGVLARAEDYRHPFLTAAGSGRGAGQGSRSGLEVHGENVVASSLRRRGGRLELRLVNESSVEREATVEGAVREAAEVDLLGRSLRALPCEPGLLRVELGPWQVRTVQLQE